MVRKMTENMPDVSPEVRLSQKAISLPDVLFRGTLARGHTKVADQIVVLSLAEGLARSVTRVDLMLLQKTRWRHTWETGARLDFAQRTL